MDQLIEHGRVRRAALGITVRNASANDAAYVGLPEIRGVIVEDFGTDASPAKRAGLEPGDIIISIDGKPVEYVAQLQQRIAFRQPGEAVKVEVARKGGVRKIYDVKLQELPAPTLIADRTGGDADSTSDDAAASVGKLGITVAPIGDDDRAQLQLQSTQRGVLVTNVVPGGPSWNTLTDGGQGGPDLITEVEGKPVRSPADLRRALEGMKPGDVVSLRVYNTGAKNRRVERIRLGE
jgi:serine protease Do